jgi:hypothetical protein
MRGIPPVAPSSSGGGGRDLGGGAIAAGLGKLGQGIQQGLGDWAEKRKAQADAQAVRDTAAASASRGFLAPKAPRAPTASEPEVAPTPTFQPVGKASETPTFAQPGGGGGAMGSSIGPASTSLPTFAQGAPGDSMGKYREAIASIESRGSGDYSAVNSKTGALGRYQVMPSNLPAWSQAALGKTMTPQEFIASPQAQDAVFNKVFGGYVDKYGPTGAANTWFTGKPNPPATASDGTTTAPQYAARFNAALGGTQPPHITSPSAAAYAATPPTGAEPAVAANPSTEPQPVLPAKPFDPNDTKGSGVNGTPYDASGKYVGYDSSADIVAPAATPANSPAPTSPQPPLLNGGQPGVYSAPQIGPQGMNDQANPLAAALAQGGQQGPQLDQSALLAMALAQNQPDFSTPDLGGFFG